MPILSVWLINKSGGLVFQKDFSNSNNLNDGGSAVSSSTSDYCHNKLSTNDYLVLASTFQSVHAIATQLNPDSRGKCSGIEAVEWNGFNYFPHSNPSTITTTTSSIPFKMHSFQSPTGLKIILLTSPRQPQLDFIQKRIYELYADFVMKNPFHQPEMPVRSEKFEINLTKLVRQMSTNNYF